MNLLKGLAAENRVRAPGAPAGLWLGSGRQVLSKAQQLGFSPWGAQWFPELLGIWLSSCGREATLFPLWGPQGAGW